MRAESLPIGVRRPPLQRKKQKSIQLLALLDNDLAHAQNAKQPGSCEPG